MRIADLKEKYPNVKFYELKQNLNNNYLVLKKIEDFIDIVKIVGYTEVEINEKEARDRILMGLVESYADNLKYPGYINNISRLSIEVFLDFINKNITKNLKKIIENRGYTITNLYGIDIAVMYEDKDSGAIISEEDFDSGLNEIDKLYKIYEKDLDKQKENREKDVHNCILNFKEMYLHAETKVRKDDIVKRVQYELRNKFNMDARSDPEASKAAIIKLFEEE